MSRRANEAQENCKNRGKAQREEGQERGSKRRSEHQHGAGPTERTVLGITLFVLMTVLASPALSAQGLIPSAKVSIESTSIAAGIGMSWGDGKLSFNGKRYHFVIDGVTFIDFGISRSSAAGEVYNLTDLAKFEGNYVAAEASFALGGGIGGVALRNQYGVVMYLRSVSQGARLQLGAGGISIRFWDQRY